MISSDLLGKVVSHVGDLPAMPDVVAEVMELTDDPNVTVSTVSEAIERDPALTAKLLKVSNSSYYGMRQVVGTLKLALVILGVREVRNIVLGISVVDVLHDDDTEILLSRRGLWKHSTLVAGLAKKLGAEIELSSQGEDFIAGLLHDIGKLVLWRQCGDEYKTLYSDCAASGRPVHEAETEKYGFDHCDVAAALASAWSLPDSLACSIHYHHENDHRDIADCRVPKLAAIVRIANLAAHDDWDLESPEDFASCTSSSWATLSETPDQYPLGVRKDLLADYVSELKNSPSLALY